MLTSYDASGGHIAVALGSGAHTIDIDLYVTTGATASMRRMRVELWKV